MRKVAVIGAGLSGLVAAKELLAEGHSVTVYEKNSDIGGVFTNCYDSVLLTVSNYFMAYSDFFPYDEPLRFWTHYEYKKYLDSYAEHFDLIRHIRFHTEVKKIQKQNNCWFVNTNIGSDSFDNVVIASGLFQKPNIPNIKGLDTFRGKTMHSSVFKNVQETNEFKNKRVLCIGLGESSSDITSEIAAVAQETILSIQRYHVFAPRMLPSHSKIDNHYSTIDAFQTRMWHSLPAYAKTKEVKSLAKSFTKSKSKEFRLFGENNILAGDEPGSVVTKTERIFTALVNHNLKLNIGGIKQVDGDTVIFNSGESHKFDVIVFCTGFKFSTPFLDFEFTEIKDCYKNMIHPELGDSIAFIGFVRPQQGGIPLMAELQSRYYALICSGKRKLPPNIEDVIQKDKQRWETEFYETPHVFGLVNGVRFNQDLAQLIGCRPPKYSLLTSPKKWYGYWFGHVWPCQYRLVGPGATDVAKKNRKTQVHQNLLAAIKLIVFANIMNLIYLVTRNPKLKIRSIENKSLKL